MSKKKHNPPQSIADIGAVLEHYHRRRHDGAPITRIVGPKAATATGIWDGITIYIVSDIDWKAKIDALIAPVIDGLTARGETVKESIQ
jgi:hypothetical protein